MMPRCQRSVRAVHLNLSPESRETAYPPLIATSRTDCIGRTPGQPKPLILPRLASLLGPITLRSR